MTIQKCRSIMFRDNVRMDPKKLGGIAATRTSLVEDTRFHAFVDSGLEAYVLDTVNKTIVRVPWHMIRDYELAEEPMVAQLLKSEKDKTEKDSRTRAA